MSVFWSPERNGPAWSGTEQPGAFSTPDRARRSLREAAPGPREGLLCAAVMGLLRLVMETAVGLKTGNLRHQREGVRLINFPVFN